MIIIKTRAAIHTIKRTILLIFPKAFDCELIKRIPREKVKRKGINRSKNKAIEK
jgi:hypothetical protein